MTTIILGGGLAGLSLAHFISDDSIILEREDRCGGLMRSYQLGKVSYDIGPHILFSKDKEALAHLLTLSDTNKLRRSNKILYKGRLLKYPFENDLYHLDAQDRDYCLTEFLNNPYEDYPKENMLQFFLSTFGEGITRLYLAPYNEKIWKFDPAYMDTQMVERIPKPPKQDVIDSASGRETEGYLHQLYFNYPKSGGIEALIKAYLKLIEKKAKVHTKASIKKISRSGDSWLVETDKGSFSGDRLVNCMPLQELFRYLPEPPKDVSCALESLRYNSIHIVVVEAKEDSLGDNFAVYVPDKDVLFHRLSKIGFLGESYRKKNSSTLLAEITFRQDSHLAKMGPDEIKKKVVEDLDKLGMVRKEDVLGSEVRTFEHAYVIYDLCHKQNTEKVLSHLSSKGVHSCGRFAEFQYLNMDATVASSMRLAAELNKG